MLLDGTEGQVWHFEVLLGIVVQTCQRPDVANRLDDDAVNKEAEDDRSKDCEGVS